MLPRFCQPSNAGNLLEISHLSPVATVWADSTLLVVNDREGEKLSLLHVEVWGENDIHKQSVMIHYCLPVK